MVGVQGLEPWASWSQTMRAKPTAPHPDNIGGCSWQGLLVPNHAPAKGGPHPDNIPFILTRPLIFFQVKFIGCENSSPD